MSETPDRERAREAFDLAIDRLEVALVNCPEELWRTSMWKVERTDPWVWPPAGTEPVPERTDESIQAYSWVAAVAHHCLWFLDFYATIQPAADFQTPEYVRGGPEELPWPADGAAPLFSSVFEKEPLLRYLDYGRQKIHQELDDLTAADLSVVCPPGHPHAGKSRLQLFRVNLNHVRGHSGEIYDFLVRHGVRLPAASGH